MKDTKEQLAKDIRTFLDKYAKISPNYKNEGDDKYTGPDPYQLLSVAVNIEQGREFIYPWSDWGSGCYGRYSDLLGREKHNELLQRIKSFQNKK